MKPFSVVISVYQLDNSNYFELAVSSVLNQTAPPDEIVIVIDGYIGEALEKSISKLSQNLRVKILRIKQNIGLGAARHQAIISTKHNIVAVMDADDLSVPTRFASQIGLFESTKVDVVGAYIEEFNNEPGDANKLRMVPLTHNMILKRCAMRSPMNHVTVMFRKSSYLNVGGYRPIRYVEDWDLFYRLLRTGHVFQNIPEVLVYVRAGQSMYSRRHGIQYLKAEIDLLNSMRSTKFITLHQWCLNCIIRGVSRLAPRIFLEILYKKFLRLSK
jgi:glycosyltransferase involved in cell wall biosynthesis